MSAIADRFPSFTRHLRIFKEAWRQQNDADDKVKPRSDHEFLPAALEIMEKPPSPGMRYLLLSLCTLFVIALLWAFIGRVDVVAVAGGKTLPAGNAKTIQPIEIGSIRAIHVRNGQYVEAGDLLIELDPTLATAEEAQSAQTLRSAEIVRARNDALLRYLSGGSANFQAPEGTDPDIVATERQLIRSAIAEYEAEHSSLTQQRAERQAELVAAQAEAAKLREALPFIEQQMEARRDLTERGYFAKLSLLEYEQAHAEHIRNIDVQNANAQRAQAAIGTLSAQIARLRESFGKGAVTDLAEANDRAALAGEELRKSARRREFQQMRAPVSGVVQQLAVTTVGGVVQPAQALMVIVPCSPREGETRPDPTRCTSAVEVEAFVQNKDIGFVEVGQRVAVKLEAFNFTDYGLLDGEVEFISRDAIDMSQRPAGSLQDDRGRPAQQGLVYVAKIRLDCQGEAALKSGLCDRVQPGMSVQAEIKTGQRRIIQYLLSPISKAMDEAARER